jgi:hypothetical protein
MKSWCRLVPSTRLLGALAPSIRGTRCVRWLSAKLKPPIDARARDGVNGARRHHGRHREIDVIGGVDVGVRDANTVDEYLSLCPS